MDISKKRIERSKTDWENLKKEKDNFTDTVKEVKEDLKDNVKEVKEDWKEVKEDLKDNVKEAKEDWGKAKEDWGKVRKQAKEDWKEGRKKIKEHWKEDRKEREERKKLDKQIKLRNKFPEIIEKIRKPITDKRIIKIEQIQTNSIQTGDNSFEKINFCNLYTVKYMPTLLHEIRQELIDEFIENELLYNNWEEYITKVYDPFLAKKEVERNFLIGTFSLDAKSNLRNFHGRDEELILLIEIIFEKLSEYFFENGWTFSEEKYEKEEFTIHPAPMDIVGNTVLYLHPPKK